MGDPFSIFRGFGGFGPHRGGFLGGKDPFDDPFFSRPFEDLLEPSNFISSASSSNAQKSNGGKGVLIEELLPDDEEFNEDKEAGNRKDSLLSREPSVEHPDDDAEVDSKTQNVNQRSDCNRAERTQAQARTFSYQTCKVTYGGVDGVYCTSSRTRRAGNDGVVLEESKEADKTTGQATHRISRGIRDKGHSVTRKLNSDGGVDTTQTLHNLDEDELGGFGEVWKGNFRGHLRGWTDGKINMHRTAGSKGQRAWGGVDIGPTSNSAARKVVRINIE